MDEVTKVEIERLREEDNRQNARIKKLEENFEAINSIAISVERLSINMQHMLEEQKNQGKRLDTLESEPASNWNNAKRVILNSILTVFASGIGAGLIWLIVNSSK